MLAEEMSNGYFGIEFQVEAETLDEFKEGDLVCCELRENVFHAFEKINE